MVQDLFESSALNCVYALVALVSFLFALVSLLGAEVGDAFDLDVDADVDAGGPFDLASISPFALAMFGATFGVVGLLTSLWLDMRAITSILVSTGAGLIIGGIAQVLFLYVFSPTKSSHFSLEKDALGREAEVIISIPGSGLGQVAYNNVSGRVTMGARSATGEEIPTGVLVTIERVIGRVALVRPTGGE